jgi:hypothetical protein
MNPSDQNQREFFTSDEVQNTTLAYSTPVPLNPKNQSSFPIGEINTFMDVSEKKKSLDAQRFVSKRVMGIEPTLPAWKAGVLPLNYTRAKN